MQLLYPKARQPARLRPWRERWRGRGPRHLVVPGPSHPVRGRFSPLQVRLAGDPTASFLDMAYRIGGSVLDAGCGTGENALFFAERGHTATKTP